MSVNFQFPIKESYHLTQKFGENLVPYAGTKGHTGLDYAYKRGTALYAVADGIVTESIGTVKPGEFNGGYGNLIGQLSPSLQPGMFYDVVYGHLLSTVVKKGEEIKQGQLIGFGDSTGYSTGDHLHFGVRLVERRKPNNEHARTYLGENYVLLDYENGYLGYIDPLPLFQEMPLTEILAVDMRYGQAYSWLREQAWSLKYDEKLVREQAYKAGFGPYEFAKMKNAFVYGYWPKQYVLDVGWYGTWSAMSYPEFEKRRLAGTLANS